MAVHVCNPCSSLTLAASPGAAVGSLLVEVPLERQMLEAVLDAGQEGILTLALFERLHLRAKKYSNQLNDVIRKYGLQVRSVTSCVFRERWTAAVLARWKQGVGGRGCMIPLASASAAWPVVH